MERKLGILVDAVKMLLNFLVVVCLEMMLFDVFDVTFGVNLRQFYTVSSAVVTSEPVFVIQLFLPVILPYLFYLYRKYCRNLLLFLVLHPVSVMLLWCAAGFFPGVLFWRVMYVFIGAVYTFASVAIRMKSKEDGEEAFHMAAAGGVAAVCMIGCGHLNDEASCSRIVWFAFLWMAGFILFKYLENYLSYLEMSRKTAGSIPENNILRAGMTGISIFGGLSITALILCSKTALVSRMTSLAKSIVKSILYVLVWVLTLFAGESEEETQMQAQPMEAGDMFGDLAETAEPSWFMELLEKIVIAATVIFLIALFVLFVYMFIRFLIRSFYGRERKKQEIREEDFTEEEEPLRREKKKRDVRLPVIGGTPTERIRKTFKRTVQSTRLSQNSSKNTLFKKKQQDTSYRSPLLYGSEAFQEKKVFEPEGKTARELSGEQKEWMQLVQLYEKARYSDSAVDMEEAKAAGKLSREIMHSIN